MSNEGIDFFALVRRAMAAPPDSPIVDQAAHAARRLIGRAEFGGLEAAVQAEVLAAGGVVLLARGRERRDHRELGDAIDWLTRAARLVAADPVRRAKIQVNVALARLERYELDDGIDRQDLDAAIDLLDSEIPRLSGDDRATALHTAGVAFTDRFNVARCHLDIDAAIARFKESLVGVRGPMLAGHLNSLAVGLRAQARADDDVELLVEAIARSEEALDEPALDGAEKVTYTFTLANTLLDLGESTGDAAMVTRAVALFQQVLDEMEPGGRRWAEAANNLATALWVAYRLGEDRGLIDVALGTITASLQRLDEGDPRWLAVASNLAAILQEMYDHVGQLPLLDRSIELSETLIKRRAQPAEAAGRRHNLAVSLEARYRRSGDLDVLDRAIRLFMEASEVESDAVQVAATRNSLGNALQLRFECSHDPADLSAAIVEHELAASATQQEPIDHATYSSNLSVALARRGELTNNDDDLDRAIAEQRAALRVVGRSPVRAKVFFALGESLAARARISDDPVVAREAGRAYAAACRVGIADAPEQAIGAAVGWAELAMSRADWEGATNAYKIGMRVVRQLFAAHEMRPHKEMWLQAVQGLPQGSAYANAKLGRLDQAVAAIEAGRAVLLHEALERRQVVRGGGRRHLPAVIYVYLIPATPGGLAIIDDRTPGSARSGSGKRVTWLPGLSIAALQKQSGLAAAAYTARLENPHGWRQALSSLGAWAWRSAMGPLIDALGQPGLQQREIVTVALIATGAAAFVPFHAAWTADIAAPGRRRYAVDRLALAYLPSLEGLRTSASPRRDPRRDARRGPVLAIVEPTPSRYPALGVSKRELDGALAGASQATVLRGPDATVERVWRHLDEAEVLHAACHGVAAPAAPLDTALLLADDEPIRAGDFLDRRLDHLRLAVLSACETGMIGEALPDEVIGLPVALLQAGADAVVASQWAVPNLATAVLVAAFYQRWHSGASVAEALRGAQVWLREATNEELERWDPAGFAPALRVGPARALWRKGRPFADPYYWAGFMVVGDAFRRHR